MSTLLCSALLRRGRIVALLFPVILTSCCPTYWALRSENEIEELAELEKQAKPDAWTTTHVLTRDENGRALNVAVHETTGPDHDCLVVLVHGVLSDHCSWRFVYPQLRKDHDLLAVDLPGCGESERPPPLSLGTEGYGPTALATRVLQALRARFATREEQLGRPSRVVLVGHSLGGTVVLRMFTDPKLRKEYEDVRQRVERLVLLAPFDVALEKVHPLFLQVAELTGFEVFLGNLTGVLHERVAAATRDNFDDPVKAPREEADRGIQVLWDGSSRAAAQAMIAQTVPLHPEDFRPDWNRIKPLVAGYAEIDKPCLIVWGARDETFPLSMGYKLATEIPTAELWICPRTKHSLALERPRLCAAIIRACTGTTGEMSGDRPGNTVRVVPSLDDEAARTVPAILSGPPRGKTLRVELVEDLDEPAERVE